MSLERVIEVSRRELGQTEYPAGSNNTKYGAAYGLQGQPWCVIFLWWLFREAGESAAFFGGAKTASCGTLLRWYKAQGQTVTVEQVQPGDIVILNFHGTQDTEHCGLVVETHWNQDASLDWIETIEGNTTASSYGSQDNGGCVSQKRRYPYQIVGVCRPKYRGTPPPPSAEPPQEGAISPPPSAEPPQEGAISSPAAPEPPQEGATPPAPAGQPPQEGARDDVKGHWAEKAIRRCMELGLMRGYEDGSFQPDRPVTRAELATVLDRLNGE